MLGGKKKVRVYQFLCRTRQLLMWLREQHKPYKENISAESLRQTSVLGLRQS